MKWSTIWVYCFRLGGGHKKTNSQLFSFYPIFTVFFGGGCFDQKTEKKISFFTCFLLILSRPLYYLHDKYQVRRTKLDEKSKNITPPPEMGQ